MTAAPGLRTLCAFGRSETTRPAFTLAEKTCLTSPTRQPYALIVRLATLRLFPRSSGTTHAFRNDAWTERSAVSGTAQVAFPVQTPDQPAKAHPLPDLAVSVTVLPTV